MKRERFYLKMAFGSLLRGRSRMAAALLGVGIGATVLSGLISVWRDIPRQMGQEFRSYGVNLVIVPAGENSSLDSDTARKAVSLIPAASLTGAAPYRYRLVKINERPFMSAGTDFGELQKTNPWWFVLGGFPQNEGEVLIGREVADTIRFVSGSSFTVSGGGQNMNFTVSGIVQTGGAEEAFIFMSMPDFEAMTGESGLADVIECSIAASGDSLRSLSDAINASVPGAVSRRVLRLTESEDTVLGKLRALVFIVTAITLLLTMICVATTMMAAVAERRREIGLKKALGASNTSLALEFLGEGALIGFLGGILGAGFGFVFAEAASQNVFSRALVFNPLLIPLTVIVSVLITGIACLFPVRSAAEVDPAIVLRGE
ncbi:MAG: ABC transporter permease [Treponema sp.]|jgi:putative ABC transport system permease protein|nr:ABC transporter permease [Treponema sp.]